MPHTRKIVVLDEDLDARAERRGEDIVTYLSYDTPVSARDAVDAHLIRALNAAEGDHATVALERGDAILVALNSARRRIRARSRLPINPISAICALIGVSFAGGMLLIGPPTSSIQTPNLTVGSDPLLRPPQSCPTPSSPPASPTPRRVTAPPVTSDRHAPSVIDVPREVMPKLPRFPTAGDPGIDPTRVPDYWPTQQARHRRRHGDYDEPTPPSPPPPPAVPAHRPAYAPPVEHDPGHNTGRDTTHPNPSFPWP
ncbi:MAG: hypothetical protein ACRDSP_14065 [Pseudonocardiaceae bacterium]